MSAFASAGIHAANKVLKLAAAAAVIVTALALASAEAATGKRVALVIGNSAYQNAPALATPANDAADMAAELRALGFTVIDGVDLTNRDMRDKIREFTNQLRGAEASLFYYSGHALQANDRNYLAPVDARLEFEGDLDFETVALEIVQRQMERETKTALLFLDASRDNPLARALNAAARSGGPEPGLAEVRSSPGTLVAFATDPDSTAADKGERNSPFTGALLANLAREDLEIQTMMTDVRQQVHEATSAEQTPWVSSSLLGRFYFKPGAETAQQVAALETSADPAERGLSVRPASPVKPESVAWDSVKDTTDPRELEAFISTYPDGFFAELAELRLHALGEQARLADARARLDQYGQDDQTRQSQTDVAVLDQRVDDGPKVVVPSVVVPPVEQEASIEPQLDARQIVVGIQQELVRLSCNPGRPDGVWGRRSQRALDLFASSAGVNLASPDPDGYLLKQLREYQGEGCPVAVRQQPAPGQVVRVRRHRTQGVDVGRVIGTVVGAAIACRLARC